MGEAARSRDRKADGCPQIGSTDAADLSAVAFDSDSIQLAPAGGLVAAHVDGGDSSSDAPEVSPTRFDGDADSLQ